MARLHSAGLRALGTANADLWTQIVASVILAAGFLYAHAVRTMRPLTPVIGNNWFGWYDQGRYLEAAQAWLRHDLSIEHHLYMPGYPLLAVPFLLRLPAFGLPLADPFLPANMAAMIATLWLLAGVARYLAPELRHAGALGALTFLAIMLLSPAALDVWVVPWSTSAATPLILLCLWAALRFGVASLQARWSFLAGFAGAAVVGFRPTDIAIALGPACLLIAWTLFSRGARWADWSKALLSGMAGSALAIGLVALAYLPIYGVSLSPYVIGSARCGFEWRLLPLRWVKLVLDPRPLLPEGQGLISAFPWLISGFAAALVFVILPNRAGRAAHAAAGGTMAAHAALYLCFRDLHSGGLWLYFNYHYFKFDTAFAGVYSAVWVAMLLAEQQWRWLRLTAGVLGIAVLLPWRAELHKVDTESDQPRWTKQGTVLMPSGMWRMSDATIVAAGGAWDDMFNGRSKLASVTTDYAFNMDFKTMPAGGGLMLIPLRPLAREALEWQIRPQSLTLDRGVMPVAARQTVVLGLPCWFWINRPACQPDRVLPRN